jgi:hypothetical protein
VLPFTSVIPLAVTAEVPTGLVVLQDRFTLQLLAFKAISQEDDAGVRVPEGITAGVTVTVTLPDSVTACVMLEINPTEKITSIVNKNIFMDFILLIKLIDNK